MDTLPDEKNHVVALVFAAVVSLSLVGLLTGLNASALAPDVGTYGGITLMFIGIALGGPLTVIAVILTLDLLAKQALHFWLFALMWLPVLANVIWFNQ